MADSSSHNTGRTGQISDSGSTVTASSDSRQFTAVDSAFSINSLEVDDSEQQPADLPTLPKKRKAAVGSGWVKRKPKMADRRPIEERKKEEEVQHRLSELDVTDEKKSDDN